MRVSAWKELGENVAESLDKGQRVVVTGRLKSRSYDNKEGQKQTVIELEAEEVAPSLRWATAKVTRAARNGTSGGFAGNAGQSQQGGGWGGQQPTQQPGGDPWAAQAAGGNWAANDGEAPF
jgi:single-strand DNA-binding protein